MCEKIMLHNFYGIREIWMFVSNIRFRNIMINWIIKNYVMFLLTKMVFSCCVCCKHILVKRIPYHYSMQNLGIKIATNSCYIYIYRYIYQCIFPSINMLFAETTSSISKHLNIRSQIKRKFCPQLSYGSLEAYFEVKCFLTKESTTYT